MKKLLIIGAGGHAKVIADIASAGSEFAVAGIIGPDAAGMVLDYHVVGNDAELPNILRKDDYFLVVAVGDNWHRGEIVARVTATCGSPQFATLVHPRATIGKHAVLGPGTVLMAGSIVNSGSRVGSHCIINTNASVDHDSVMEDYASLAPGASMGGAVCLGAYSAVSLGASIVHGIRIGEHSVIGAGATVVRDVPSYVVAYGNPCRVVRPRKPGDPYLHSPG